MRNQGMDAIRGSREWLVQGLDEITSNSRALRSGGCDAGDLVGLEEALQSAIDVAQEMIDELEGQPCPAGQESVAAVGPALATTGKQQVGDTGCGACGDGCVDRPACRVAEESPPAQVGEVQGDALVIDEMVQTFKSALARAQLPEKTRTYFLKDSELPSLLREVLAARQPGAQGPVAGPYLDEPDAPSNPLWKRLRSIANWLTVLAPDCHMEAAELLLTASARIQRNDAAPPAQGIDLGQQRPLIARSLAEWHEDDGNVMWWAWCGRDWTGEPAWCGTPNDSDWPGYHTHWTQHPAKPALIGQGDAAPEVRS